MTESQQRKWPLARLTYFSEPKFGAYVDDLTCVRVLASRVYRDDLAAGLIIPEGLQNLGCADGR